MAYNQSCGSGRFGRIRNWFFKCSRIWIRFFILCSDPDTVWTSRFKINLKLNFSLLTKVMIIVLILLKYQFYWDLCLQHQIFPGGHPPPNMYFITLFFEKDWQLPALVPAKVARKKLMMKGEKGFVSTEHLFSSMNRITAASIPAWGQRAETELGHQQEHHNVFYSMFLMSLLFTEDSMGCSAGTCLGVRGWRRSWWWSSWGTSRSTTRTSTSSTPTTGTRRTRTRNPGMRHKA